MKISTASLLLFLVPICLMAQSPLIPFVVDEDPPVEDADSLLEDTEPRALNMEEVRKAISYPKAAADANIEGQVIARILVSRSGRIIRYEIWGEADPILDEAVRNKVHMLKFSKAVVNGRAVPCWVDVPFNFRLIKS
ncbi:MAG: energy transducer TonB [Bacteroidota bacterium]